MQESSRNDSGSSRVDSELEKINDSGIFEEQEYLELNPDVAAAVSAGATTAKEHFVTFGLQENRQFSRLFDAQFYLEAHADVAAAVSAGATTATQHFFEFGVKEERSFNALFDRDFYLKSHSDIDAAVTAGVTTATRHFFEFGVKEERSFNALFDRQFYLFSNPDVDAAVSAGITTAEEHFFEFGIKEERTFNALFDRQFYLFSNPDVDAAVSAGIITAEEHFFEFGINEERTFNALFDLDYYLRSHTDIAAAVSAGVTTAAEHFFEFGIKEERSFNALFDLEHYLNINTDVAAAVTAGITTAAEHFFEFGIKEERSFNALFDLEHYLNINTDVAAAVSAGITTAAEHFFEFGITEERSFNAFFDRQLYLNANPDVAAAVAAGVTTATEHFFEFGINENRTYTSFIAPILNPEAFSQTFTADIANFFNVESVSELDSEDVIESIFDTSAPTIDIEYVRTEYAAELESFYGFTVAELSNEQVEAYALEQGREAGLKLSALDIEGYRVQYAERLVAFYQVSSVERLTVEQVEAFMVGEGLNQGIDIAGFVDIDYYRSTYQASLSARFGAEFSNSQVIDFVFGNAAPYLDEEYYKSIYGDIFTAEGVRVSELTSEQLKVYVFTEGWNPDIELSAVNIEGYRVRYAAQLSAFYFSAGGGSGGGAGGGAGGSGDDSGDGAGGGDSGMSDGGQDGGGGNSGDVSELTDKQIIEFMFDEGIKQGISPLEFVAVAEVRRLFAAELTQFYSVANVAELSDNLVLDFLFGGVAEKIDYEYYRTTYESELVAAFGVSVELISETQILDHVYQVGLVQGFELSAIDYDAYIARYTTEIASHFTISVEEVSELSIERVREFIFGAGLEKGLSIAGFVDAAYVRSTYAVAIANSFEVTVETVTTSFTDAQILEWFASESQSIDFEYIRYEIAQLSVEERTELYAALGFTIETDAVLTVEQVIEIAYSAEFKAIIEVESAKTIAIDIEGYRKKYAKELEDCLDKDTQDGDRDTQDGDRDTQDRDTQDGDRDDDSGDDDNDSGDGRDDDSDDSDDGDNDSGDDDSDDGDRDDDSDNSDDGDNDSGDDDSDDGDRDDDSGDGDRDTQDGDRDTQNADRDTQNADRDTQDADGDTQDADGGNDGGGNDGGNQNNPDTTDDIDTSKFSDKEVIEFMFGEGWKKGIDPLEFVEVDYLRQTFEFELTQHYKVESVLALSDALVVDFVVGGVSTDIDFEYYRASYELDLTREYGISIEQITDTQILDHVYRIGLDADFDLAPIDIDSYVAEYEVEIANSLSIEIEAVRELSYVEIQEFAFGAGLELGLDLTSFVDVEYYEENFSAEILSNYRAENVYNVDSSGAIDFLLEGGLVQGTNVSKSVDVEWYRQTYAAAISNDTADIDIDGNGAIDDGELIDYITGIGLEKGQNPSPIIDLDGYRAAGSASSQDLLLFYSATDISQVTYEQTLEFMFGAGIEAGHTPSAAIDLQGFRSTNSQEIVAHFGVSSVEEVTLTQTFNYFFGAGYETAGALV
ncbi:MAG: hypothetical protein SWY16_18725 [Cyanobacteriota bacterium]|nr:hypothetical protein [Cyanobacteriota bacterium]